MRISSDIRLRLVDDGEYGKYGVGTSETVCMGVERDRVDKNDSVREVEVMEAESYLDGEEGDVDDSDDNGLDDTAYDVREAGNLVLESDDDPAGSGDGSLLPGER